ncbi:hypothetical protein PspLS_02239, partial [Pyricularia sp. CBS 133598]
MEPLGLTLGVLGVAGLFKYWRSNLSDWYSGASRGAFASPQGDSTPYNSGLDRPEIKEVVEASLDHLRLLLEKASMVTDSFALSTYDDSPPSASGILLVSSLDSTPGSMSLFRDRFEAFRHRMHANQKQKSAWKTTRWAVHDAAAFKATVDRIKQLVNGLESTTGTLENLLQRQRAALVEEIESVSDTRSLRLIQMTSGSSNDPDASKRLIDAASHQLSLVESSVGVSGSAGYPWFSERSTVRYSLGALLTATCALLASPNVDDSLVLEIAELYTLKYAQETLPPEFEDVDLDDPHGDQKAVTLLPREPMDIDELSPHRFGLSDTLSIYSRTSKPTFRTVKLETFDSVAGRRAAPVAESPSMKWDEGLDGVSECT